jgi:hypothetical protein
MTPTISDSASDSMVVSTPPATPLLSDTMIIALAASAGGLLLIGLVACICCIAKKKKKKKKQQKSTADSMEMAVTPASPVPYYGAPTPEPVPQYHAPPRSLPYNYVPMDSSEMRNTDTTGDSLRTTTGVLQIPIEQVSLGKKLGEGAFGVVYQGDWHDMKVAIKQIKSSTIAGGDKALAEFEAEISKMASVGFHKNLVQLHGVTTLDNGDMAAVVEYCSKGSLSDALYGGKAREHWSRAELFAVAYGAACGVAYLHLQGVIHRDIAARNVLLAGKRDVVAKVSDFGMARLVVDSVYSEQMTSTNVGPLKWMAPEQMERRAYSRASDVFAFGVLLFEIFKREQPWKDVSNIVTATKVMQGERMDISSHMIPDNAAALMKQCWAASPDARPSMKEVERMLREDVDDESE